MAREGKYIYCIVGANEGRNFGSIGIGKQGNIVTTIGYNDISAAISNSPLDQYVINRDNLTAHERVIEQIMKDYTVLPVRFCTIANNVEEVRGFLRRRYSEFRGLLRDLDNKVEMGLKGRWKEMKQVFAEIAEEDPKVLEMKAKVRGDDEAARVALGKAVKDALTRKKMAEADPIVAPLRRAAVNVRESETIGDDMFLNATFLVDRTRERQFDFLVEDLARAYGERVDFTYVGPAPPFNFVNLVMKL